MTIKASDDLRLWDAYIAPTQRVALADAAGRIAASTIRQYPPGIPDIIPGGRYSLATIRALENAHAANIDIIGVDMADEMHVEVIALPKKTGSTLDTQVFETQDISDVLAVEIADFFRISFSGGPYFHYAFHESEPLQSLPHTLDFEAYAVSVALPDTEKRKACQESLRGIAYERAIKEKSFPRSELVHLPDGFHLWTDKEICRTLIKDRFTDPGYVTLVKNPEDDALLGLLHARMGTVERLFYSEEWSDPLLFSQYSDENEIADSEEFFEKINYHFGLKPHDPIMTISAQVLVPDIQGGDVFYKMMRSMAERIKPQHACLPILSEIPPHGTAHQLNTAINERIIFGVLKNAHPLVYCSQMSQSLFLMIGEKNHWNHALRRAVREAREYRTQYYISQPTDYSAVTVRPYKGLGLAAFADRDIPSSTRIAIFTGEKYQSETALGLPEIMRDHAIQIGPKEFVFGHKGLAHCLCHSCDPNCGIRHLTEIFAVRDIEKGEQLTWDYRCSENSNWVLENCLCGSDRCTHLVSNFDSLPANMKSEYLSKSMVSEWIVSSLQNQEDGSTSSEV